MRCIDKNKTPSLSWPVKWAMKKISVCKFCVKITRNLSNCNKNVITIIYRMKVKSKSSQNSCLRFVKANFRLACKNFLKPRTEQKSPVVVNHDSLISLDLGSQFAWACLLIGLIKQKTLPCWLEALLPGMDSSTNKKRSQTQHHSHPPLFLHRRTQCDWISQAPATTPFPINAQPSFEQLLSVRYNCVIYYWIVR